MDDIIMRTKMHAESLRENTVRLSGETLYYRLSAIRRLSSRIYIVSVRMGKEGSTCCFGKDRREAEEIYRKIVENTVTPCTLRDVAEDFSKRHQNRGR